MTYLTLYELLGYHKQYVTSNSSVSFTNNIATQNASSINLLQFTIPEGKLFYPEPFIASASYLHSDLTYLHLFQYWYWLWFLFIFLICFFLISFISTLRWCTIRIRPRRETRGVSRSKCGDLITACVPVSWAISIIVNESADSTDVNDGFGTSELVVGVRAYQWGWEYYYPKAIDLNYNVKSNYSSFVGHSLQYNHVAGYTLSSQTLWRMYQNKDEDIIITPAHVLFTPLTTTGVGNFADIGTNTLQETSAFSKIRNSTKAYTTHLVYTPSLVLNKYTKLQTLYFNENNFLQTSSFSVKPQHTLLSSRAQGSYPVASNLDEKALQKFLQIGLESQDINEKTSAFKSSLTSISPKIYTFPTVIHTTFALSQLFQHIESTFSTFTNTLLYPSFFSKLNNDSDKHLLQNVFLKLNAELQLNLMYMHMGQSFISTQSHNMTSYSFSIFEKAFLNAIPTLQQFSLNGPNSKVLLGDQSIRSSLPKLPQTPDLNLATSMNPLNENKNLYNINNRPFNIFLGSLLNKSSYIDYKFFNRLSTSQSFNVNPQPAIQSLSSQSLNPLEQDTTSSYLTALNYTGYKGVTFLNQKISGVAGDLFVGSREKTPKALNTSYWSTFWVDTIPFHRVSTLLALNSQRVHFYLPIFTNYADYDFRNDQAFELLEDLFWETSYSSYNFLDYMSLSQAFSSIDSVVPQKDINLEKNFHNSTLGVDEFSQLTCNSLLKDISSQQTLYTNSIQMEEYAHHPINFLVRDYTNLSLYSDLGELEDTFNSFKTFYSLFLKLSNICLANFTPGFTIRSYISVFNSFRSDLEDFQFYHTDKLTSYQNFIPFFTHGLIESNNNSSENTQASLDFRVLNPISLRSSVRNSIVNSNAFQKVFKPRLDESRALVNSSSYADLAIRQPFLSDKTIPYTQLLGKNRSNFFSTPLYLSRASTVINTLQPLLTRTNTPFFDFPFLPSKTSDTMRFTWLDWFSKWAYIEVQPSSVSRYSTLGVPYFRRPFDFNSTTGDKFQDVELYFTRVSRSRRNYLPTWLYSPFLSTRTYLWNTSSVVDSSFLNVYTQLSLTKYSCTLMHWYWNSLLIRNTLFDMFSYSNSGNNIYSKSTYQPRTSIQSYYTSIASLTDILSHREYLYRLLIGNRFSVVSLPKNVLVTPSNPFVIELKSSFLFSDPATFSSESSRELLYTNSVLLQINYLQEVLDRVSNFSTYSIFNVNSSWPLYYLAYYFSNSSNTYIGQNFELTKSQFRPLKKGISNMLRLHATGAIAMPIEIRLQVLASSRDVIHSWSIPSASVKIDCVPGYTSHKMMKFFLTGVYWGQCQEICGRYHHWMPIVVYFMKRDLFFLWCTHFVFTQPQSSTWDISDRRFASLGRSASYDQSLWLSEFGIHY